jgi:hypothetical protein
MSFIGQGLTGLSFYSGVSGLVAGYTGYGEHGLTGLFYTEDGLDVGNTGLWRIKGSQVKSGDSFEVTGVSAEYISTLTLTNDGNGSATGPSVVIDGVATPILAVPNANYQFNQWVGVTGSATFSSPTGASSNVTVTGGDFTAEATFKYITYALVYTNDGNGSATGPITVNSGVANPILAVPNPNFQFNQWVGITGAVSFGNASSASTTVTITSGPTGILEATFKYITYAVTYTNDGHGSATGPATVNSGQATPVLAAPEVGYGFLGWTGTSGTAVFDSASSAATNVTVTGGAATIKALFSNDNFTLTVTSDGNGTTIPSGAVPVVSYAATPISAIPTANYVFDHWSAAGDAIIASATSASTTVTLDDVNDTVTAHFAYSAERAGPNFNDRDWDRSKPDFFQADPYSGTIVKMSTNPRDGERLTEEQQYQ